MAVLAIEQSLRSQLLTKKYEVGAVDCLSFIDKFLAEAARSVYENLNGFTGPIYDYFVHNWTIKPEANDRAFGQNIAPLTKKFEKYLLSKTPDIAICVHPFSAALVSYYKKRHNLTNLRLIVCLTDFRANPFWYVDSTDYYIVPTPEAKQDLMNYGAAASKIKLLGIPVRKGFLARFDETKIKKRHGIETDLPIVLVQAGSLRSGVYTSITNRLVRLLAKFTGGSGFFLIILLGTNKKLLGKINLIINKKHLENIKAIGFTERVPELMAITDLLVTKAGGLICSEAAVMGIPILITGRYFGEERTNTDFLVKNMAAVHLKPNEKIYDKIRRLLKNKQKLKLIAKNAQKISKPRAAQDIAKLVSKLLEE